MDLRLPAIYEWERTRALLVTGYGTRRQVGLNLQINPVLRRTRLPHGQLDPDAIERGVGRERPKGTFRQLGCRAIVDETCHLLQLLLLVGQSSRLVDDETLLETCLGSVADVVRLVVLERHLKLRFVWVTTLGMETATMTAFPEGWVGRVVIDHNLRHFGDGVLGLDLGDQVV